MAHINLRTSTYAILLVLGLITDARGYGVRKPFLLVLHVRIDRGFEPERQPVDRQFVTLKQFTHTIIVERGSECASAAPKQHPMQRHAADCRRRRHLPDLVEVSQYAVRQLVLLQFLLTLLLAPPQQGHISLLR